MSDYFLYVDILVEDRKSAMFEERVERLIRKQAEKRGAFSSYGWEFKLGLKASQPFEYKPPQRLNSSTRVKDERLENALCRRYVNVWNVPDPPDVALVMQQLADDSEYAEINDMVVREIQNLVLNISRRPFPTTDRAVRVSEIRRQFLTKNMGRFLFASGALLPLFEANQCFSFGRYQNVTGHLNTIIELICASESDLSRIKEQASTIPALRRFFADIEATPQAEWRDDLSVYLAPPH